MRTYYRGPDARVTDQHFIRRTPSVEAVFAVRDLRNVVRVQGAPAPDGMGGLLAAGAGMVALTAASWSLIGPAAGYAVAGVAVIVAVVMVAARRRSDRWWHVRATYRGAEIILYSSADQQMFNQVARALMRAIEDSGSVPEVRRLATA
ncbi:DUF6232 family protein [Actinoplanes sp. NPDC049681]|uniref:DUF6232 family protein n=1 Tax=Actinoplanes sp. NPDC049681 TaxID=3363905 RepID=UPI0037AE6406